jgi:hypothetical protein
MSLEDDLKTIGSANVSETIRSEVIFVEVRPRRVGSKIVFRCCRGR